IQQFAPGGRVGGKEGVDKNLAWLTKDEFVVKKSAVQHFGLGFMHAINNMRLPKFNVGGVVGAINNGMQSSIPRFADGGLNVGAGSSSNTGGGGPGRTFTLA